VGSEGQLRARQFEGSAGATMIEDRLFEQSRGFDGIVSKKAPTVGETRHGPWGLGGVSELFELGYPGAGVIVGVSLMGRFDPVERSRDRYDGVGHLLQFLEGTSVSAQGEIQNPYRPYRRVIHELHMARGRDGSRLSNQVTAEFFVTAQGGNEPPPDQGVRRQLLLTGIFSQARRFLSCGQG
jgi:hypothetical protein